MSDPKALSPTPTQTPVLGPDGLMSREWVLYFQNLAKRVGGAYSDTLTTVAGNVSTATTGSAAAQASVATLQGNVNSLTAASNSLTNRIAALENTLDVASGSWTPTFTGATVTQPATFTGTWKSVAREFFWEVQIVVGVAGSVAFAAATITNMPTPAAVAGTFSVSNLGSAGDHGNGAVVGQTAYIPNFTLPASTSAVLSGRYVI